MGYRWFRAGAVVAGLLIGPAPDASSADAERVRVTVDVQGELVTPAGRDVGPVRQPIVVAGRFDFVEISPTATGGQAAIRSFIDASATIEVDGDTNAVGIPADARRIHVAREGTAAVPYLADAFLTREERDLLDIPFDPLLLEGLRPASVVTAGDRWKVPADIAAGLLAIDTIEVGTIEARLEDVTDCQARVTLSGVIDGAIDGVPTHLVLEGRCTLPAAPDITSDDTALRYRLDGGVSQVDVTLRERRQASHVAAGFEVEARVAVNRSPHDGDEPAEPDPAAPPAGPPRRRGAGGPGLLWLRDVGQRFDLVHDARWRAVETAPGTVVMRYVDLGALVAQCSITALPPAGTSAPTVDEVQRDIRRSLAGQFERFESASATTREDGVTVVRVSSLGTAESLPFRWVHHVLADASGRRASVAFMMEVSMAERFGTADQALVDGLLLVAEPGDGGPATREARLPRKTPTP